MARAARSGAASAGPRGHRVHANKDVGQAKALPRPSWFGLRQEKSHRIKTQRMQPAEFNRDCQNEKPRCKLRTSLQQYWHTGLVARAFSGRLAGTVQCRSEERRVGKEWRWWWCAYAVR